MKGEENKLSKQDNSKNIVKEIFEGSKTSSGKVSAIFTHSKQPPKPLPQKKAKERSFFKKLPLAVDIGNHSIKILQLAQSKSKDGLEVICIDKEQYSSDKKNLFNYQKQALINLIRRNKVSSEIINSLSIKDVQVYNLVFPAMPEAELNEAIRWKIDQLKPFGLSPDKVEFSFIKCDSLLKEEAVQKKILLVCVSKEFLGQRLSLFQQVGLKVLAIEPAPLTLVNLDKFHKVAGALEAAVEDEITMWLDLGSATSTLVISKNGVLHFCRALTLTCDHMTNQIMHHCSLRRLEAEVVKKEYGLSSWSQDESKPAFSNKDSLGRRDESLMVYSSLVSSMENLVIDIEHSFKYFSYQVTKSQITKFDRLILLGGGSNLKNLSSFLNAKLGVPVEKIKDFSLFRFSDNLGEKKKYFYNSAAEFAVCMGMALGRQNEQQKRINFLPKKGKTGKNFLLGNSKQQPFRFAVLALILLGFLVSLQIKKERFYNKEVQTASGRLKQAQLKLSSLQSKQLKLTKEEGKLSNKNVILKAKLNFLNEAIQEPRQFSSALIQISNFLTEEMWVTKLTYLKKKLNINGSTSNIDSAMQMVGSMKQSKDFNDAAFVYSQKELKTGLYNFEITAQIK